jgi:glycosyltransferase involved in cell wall biosynthesis
MLGLSFGLPVVAPDVGTAAELLGTEAGELFSPGGLTAALDAASRADSSARAAAATSVARRYDWDRVGHETVGLYRELSAGVPGRAPAAPAR